MSFFKLARILNINDFWQITNDINDNRSSNLQAGWTLAWSCKTCFSSTYVLQDILHPAGQTHTVQTSPPETSSFQLTACWPIYMQGTGCPDLLHQTSTLPSQCLHQLPPRSKPSLLVVVGPKLPLTPLSRAWQQCQCLRDQNHRKLLSRDTYLIVQTS